MNHIDIANRAGVTLADMADLLRGRANANVANRLGVSMADVEYFISGSPSLAITERLGLGRNISAAQELARTGGPACAIGVVIGILLESE